MSILNGRARQELNSPVLDPSRAADGPAYKHKNAKKPRRRRKSIAEIDAGTHCTTEAADSRNGEQAVSQDELRSKRERLLRPGRTDKAARPPDARQDVRAVQGLAATLRDKNNGFNNTLWLSGIRQIVKTGDQAACLCQLLYWYGKGANKRARLGVNKQGKLWVAKSYQEFGNEVGLTERQARSALDGLVQAGLLERRPFVFGDRKVCHFRILPEALQQALTNLMEGS